MPEEDGRKRNSRFLPIFVCSVFGIFCIGLGSVVIWTSFYTPGSAYDVFARVLGLVNIIFGGALCYWPLRLAVAQLKPMWRGPWRVRRRRRRSRQGLCVKCGYNLKGLSHLRCPECGHQNVPYEEYDEYAPLDNSRGE